MVSDHVRFIIVLDEIQLIAADVELDSTINFNDSKKISDYVRYIIDSLN